MAIVGLLVLLAPLGLGAKPAQAAQSRYGNVIFTAPSGWKQVSQPNDLLFIAPAVKEGTAILGVLRGQVLTGRFRAWFDAALKASLSSGERVVDQTAVSAGRGDNAYDVLYTLRVVQGSASSRSYRFYLAAHPGNRVEMIVYFASSKAAFSKYQNVLTAFIASLHFANVPAKPATQPQPVTPPKAGAGPQSQAPAAGTTDGVTIFFGERSDLMFVPSFGAPGGGSYQYQIRKFYYTLLPGNRVYNGLPPADNLAHVCDSQGAGNCGSYTVQGQTLQITWDTGSTQQLAGTAGGASLQLGNVTMNQMSPAPSGLTLNGTYGYTNFVDISGAGGSGSVSSDHTISFGGDGTFSLTDFIGLVNAGDNRNNTTSSRSNGSGTYQFDGYSIQFTFADGTTARHVFFILPGQGGGDAIAIDGTLYLKQS